MLTRWSLTQIPKHKMSHIPKKHLGTPFLNLEAQITPIIKRKEWKLIKWKNRSALSSQKSSMGESPTIQMLGSRTRLTIKILRSLQKRKSLLTTLSQDTPRLRNQDQQTNLTTIPKQRNRWLQSLATSLTWRIENLFNRKKMKASTQRWLTLKLQAWALIVVKRRSTSNSWTNMGMSTWTCLASFPRLGPLMSWKIFRSK